MELHAGVAVTLHVLLQALVLAAPAPVQTKLELVQVIWRHGDRTPDTLYPNDIYTEVDFEPFGLGRLTPLGRRRAFALGKALRQRYDEFLGSTYSPSLQTVTAGLPRTQDTADLVMSALWPPSNRQIWSDGIGKMWMPVTHTTIRRVEDNILLPLESPCPRRYEEQRRLENSDTYKSKLLEVFGGRELLDYYMEHLGRNLTTMEDYYNSYHVLATEDEMGFELPAWTEKIFPEPSKTASNVMTSIMTATQTSRRLFSGSMIKLLLENANDAANKSLSGEVSQKLIAFSGHDITLINVLHLFHLIPEDYLEMPKYSSALIVELHRDVITDKFGLKFFFTDPTSSPIQMSPKGCEEFCHLDKIARLVADDIPDDLEKECQMEEPKLSA